MTLGFYQIEPLVRSTELKPAVWLHPGGTELAGSGNLGIIPDWQFSETQPALNNQFGYVMVDYNPYPEDLRGALKANVPLILAALLGTAAGVGLGWYAYRRWVR